MSNLLDMPLVLASLAFLAGYVLAKLGSLLRRNPDKPVIETERDRQQRSLEAELRVAQKKLEQTSASMAERERRFGELSAELEELREQVQAHDAECSSLKLQLREECEKTDRLRNELSDRAEQGIRSQVRLRDIETELSLAQAGSDVVNDEIEKLIAERDELTARLTAMETGMHQKPVEEDVKTPLAPAGATVDC